MGIFYTKLGRFWDLILYVNDVGGELAWFILLCIMVLEFWFDDWIFTEVKCFCQDWHGCIMQQSIVGQENIHPYKFSECSLDDYITGFRDSKSMCLLNKPNEVIFFLQLK